MRRCYITGTGLVSAQGVGVDANWTALLAGNVLHETGRVPVPADPKLPRVSQLGLLAAREALAEAGDPDLCSDRVALVVGTSKGPIEDWIDQLNGRRPPSIGLGLAQVAADIAGHTRHAHGPRLTLAGACASGLQALIRAADLIRAGTCDAALVVAAEASTHPLFVANFARLGVLAESADGCRPFDQNRRGFLVAEGAAAVWLSSTASAGAIELRQGLSFGDATHLTGIDRHGQSLRRLLGRLTTEPVDLLHAHGTGTLLNDQVEWSAISAITNLRTAAVYSHKHAIGHTQGAAGLISVVLNVRAHQCGNVPGNANSTNPLADLGPCFVKDASVLPVQSSLSIAAGFGGTLAGVHMLSRSLDRSTKHNSHYGT